MKFRGEIIGAIVFYRMVVEYPVLTMLNRVSGDIARDE